MCFHPTKESLMAARFCGIKIGLSKFLCAGNTSIFLNGMVMLACPKTESAKPSGAMEFFFDVGYQWLEWWERECNGGNQLEDVFWGVKPMDRFKNQLSFPWVHNGLRHSACTYSSNHIRFDGAREWLAERFGHSVQTQNRFYTEPIKADQAAAFFDLTPEKVLG